MYMNTDRYAAGVGQVYLRRESMCFLDSRVCVWLCEELSVKELLQVRAKDPQVTHVIDAAAVDGVFQETVHELPLKHLPTWKTHEENTLVKSQTKHVNTCK